MMFGLELKLSREDGLIVVMGEDEILHPFSRSVARYKYQDGVSRA